MTLLSARQARQRGKRVVCLFFLLTSVLTLEAFAQPPARPIRPTQPPQALPPFLPGPLPPGQFLPAQPPAAGAPLTTNTPFLPPPAAPAINPRADYQGEIHLEISQGALNELLRQQKVDRGPVQDFIAGAAVSGLQTTETRIEIDCTPSQENAQFYFVVTGSVDSTTTARTPQAEVLQQGNTPFHATKAVLLDGETIKTQQTLVRVMPNQRVMSARSVQGRMPLFGRLADRIAYNVAVARTPQSNLQAGQRVLQKLQPKIDNEIDPYLAQANTFLKEEVWPRLEEWNMEPEAKIASSSANRLYWDYRIGEQPVDFPFSNNTSEPTEPMPIDLQTPGIQRPAQPSSRDLELHLHESLFTKVAARRKLAGRQVSINEMQRSADRLLSLFTEEIGQSVEELPVEIDFRFADSNPIQAQFVNDTLRVQLRGVFQSGDLPSTEIQQIRLTITAELDDSSILFKTTAVEVQEEDSEGNLLEPGITQTAITTQLRKQLQPIRLARGIPLRHPKLQGKEIRVQELSAEKGWWTIKLVLNDTVSPVDSNFTAPDIPASPDLPGPALVPQP